jgi:endonuclease/exonuclease/phosphatase family metal-dependent hydrolase
MRIVTYNFRLGGKKGEQNQWRKILSDFNPDIVLAQEVRHPQVDIPDLYKANESGFLWSPITDHWGNLLFTRQGKITQLNLPGLGNWVTGVEITELNWPHLSSRSLRIFNVHVPTREGVHKVILFLNDLLDKIVEFSSEGNLIIGGDFNLTVGLRGKNDSKNSQTLLTRLRKEFGLINCWQIANPNQPLPQTLRWGSDKTVPYHCDGIFVPAAWYQYLDSCEVVTQGWETLSDHNPVIATFNLSTSNHRQV